MKIPSLFIMNEKKKTRAPALNPLNFKQLVQSESLEKNRTEHETRLYEIKVLKLLLPVYGLSKKDVSVYFDGMTKNPYETIVSGGPEELRRVWVRKLKGIPIGKLVKDPLRTKAFEVFRELVVQYKYPVGMIFPVLSYGDWIMHTLGCPVDRGHGAARLVVQATREDVPDLWIEPLEQFVNVRKEQNV